MYEYFCTHCVYALFKKSYCDFVIYIRNVIFNILFNKLHNKLKNCDYFCNVYLKTKRTFIAALDCLLLQFHNFNQRFVIMLKLQSG